MQKLSLTLLFLSLTLLYGDPSFSPLPNMGIKDSAKYKLGEKLFFDKKLSSDGTISCATCHTFKHAGCDNLKLSRGVKGAKGFVNTPTVFNAKYNISQDWIGHSETLLQKTKKAYFSEVEMHGDVKKSVKYIKSTKDLKDRFMQVYGDITGDYMFDAIAYYVQNLLTPNSKFDKFLKGDKSALNSDEKEGYRLFKGYGCSSCHNGINIGGNMYQKFGIFHQNEELRKKILNGNLGRYEVTKKEYDKYVFKVPSLRNISKTAPYFHSGMINDLKKAIKIEGRYQVGIDIPDKDVEKIEKFLKTLNGEILNEAR